MGSIVIVCEEIRKVKEKAKDDVFFTIDEVNKVLQ